MVDAKSRGPEKDTWRTPPEVLKRIETLFMLKFTLDPCSAPDNHLGLETFYTEKDDGLRKAWSGIAFVNPPYSNKWEWVSKAFREATRADIESFVLLENLVESKDFHAWSPVCDTYLLKGRIKFLNDKLEPEGNGFRGSMLLHFKPRIGGGIYLLDLKGSGLRQDRLRLRDEDSLEDPQ